MRAMGEDFAELQAYRQVAEAVSAGVVLEILVPDERDAAASLAPVAEAVRRARLRFESVVVSSAADLKSWQPGAKRPEKPTVEEICGAARAAFPGVKLGGGMLSTFTELNRKRPKGEPFDYVMYTTCSIVHAADDRSVMETLETLPAIIASTRAMIGDKAHHIGPERDRGAEQSLRQGFRPTIRATGASASLTEILVSEAFSMPRGRSVTSPRALLAGWRRLR